MDEYVVLRTVDGTISIWNMGCFALGEGDIDSNY